jgi:hypothetical protein
MARPKSDKLPLFDDEELAKDWVPQEFCIKTDEGDILLKGEVRGSWGIRSRVNDFVLTYLPLGHGVPIAGLSESRAKELSFVLDSYLDATGQILDRKSMQRECERFANFEGLSYVKDLSF